MKCAYSTVLEGSASFISRISLII